MLRKNWLPKPSSSITPTSSEADARRSRSAKPSVYHFVEVVIALDGHIHGRRLDGGFGQTDDVGDIQC